MASSVARGAGDLATLSMHDEAKLQAFGYNQVLHRGWDRFTNAAVTLSAMSVLLSIPCKENNITS